MTYPIHRVREHSSVYVIVGAGQRGKWAEYGTTEVPLAAPCGQLLRGEGTLQLPGGSSQLGRAVLTGVPHMLTAGSAGCSPAHLSILLPPGELEAL